MTNRPLIQLPSWDGKLVLAAIFIMGYYSLVWMLVLGTRDLGGAKADIVRDAMLTLGPPIGVIVGALFRSTGAEERREALRSTELQQAIRAPSSVPGEDTAGDVEQGARDGTRQGVREAIAEAPVTTDRVDRGRFPGIEDIIAPADEPLPDYARP